MMTYFGRLLNPHAGIISISHDKHCTVIIIIIIIVHYASLDRTFPLTYPPSESTLLYSTPQKNTLRNSPDPDFIFTSTAMIFSTRIFRIPRPRSFLYLMSLRTGTELITLSLLLNKLSGLYGLLALLAGLHLSLLQLSMYIYSLLALILTALLAPHIRTQSPFHCLALATFYIFDSLVNAAYTAVFAVTWFLVISQQHSAASGDALQGAGASTIDDTAGFTSPIFNVSHVDIVVTPDLDPVAVGTPGGLAATAVGPSLGHGVLQPESISSVMMICALWATRVYFVLVVMSYARLVLRQRAAPSSHTSPSLHAGVANDAAYLDNPFAPHLPEGRGWQGRLGRAMVRVATGYWLGSEEGDEAWVAREAARRLRKRNGGEAPGVVERERRKRSGTLERKGEGGEEGGVTNLAIPGQSQGQFLRV
jgi:hypothetical protein